MPDEAGTVDTQTGEIILPPRINLSSANVLPYGLYLIDDGANQFLWVGRDAVPALLMDVFGVEDRTAIRQGKTTMPVLDNEFNERVRAVIEKSKDFKSKGVGSIVVPSLYVIRVSFIPVYSPHVGCKDANAIQEDGEPALKLWAQTLLVEDRADQGVSLQQWMGMLREKVVT